MTSAEIRKYTGLAFNVARSMRVSREDAEDIAAEAMYRLLSGRIRTEGVGVCAKRLAMDLLHRRSNRDVLVSQVYGNRGDAATIGEWRDLMESITSDAHWTAMRMLNEFEMRSTGGDGE